MTLRQRLRLLRARARAGVTATGPVELGPGVRLETSGGGRIELGPGVRLSRGTRLHAVGGRIEIGSDTSLGERCVVVALESVAVGARCRLGDEVVLVDADPIVAEVERPVRGQGVVTGPVRLGDGVLAGPGACVLRGVAVGPDARIGAHAVVTRDVSAGAEVLGVPAHRPDGPRPDATDAVPAAAPDPRRG